MIQDQQQDFRLFVLDDVPMGLVVLDQDLVVRHWNATLETWTGVMRDDIIGRALDQTFPESIASQLAAGVRTISRGGRPRVHILQDRGDPLAPPRAERRHQVVLTPMHREPLREACFLLTIPEVPEKQQDAVASKETTQSIDEIGIRERLHEIGIDEDPDTMSALLNDFIDSAEHLAGRLNDAVHQRDREEVATIAHRLAGSAITLGAQSLGSAARELERLAKEMAESEMDELTGKLLGKIERVCRICGEMV